MGVSALVNNGEITNIGKSYEEQKEAEKSSNTVDKEQFLQLLVAQMKYQDPMEPTNNTEYVSQLATFSELEQMQNMSKSTDAARAQDLVGKVVTVQTTNEVTGVTNEVTGAVDKVVISGGTTYIVVADTQYELDDVKQVWDDEYADASTITAAWSTVYNQLPSADLINSSNVDQYTETIETLMNSYNSMTTYQKSLISSDEISGLQGYVDRLTTLGVSLGDDE